MAVGDREAARWSPSGASRGAAKAPGIVAWYAERATAASSSGGRWGEMIQPHGALRTAWRQLGALADRLGTPGLTVTLADARRLLQEDRVTYRALGSEGEQSWGLDPVPVLIDEGDWATLEPGLIQRAETLDLLLADLYGARETVRTGLIPTEIVHGRAGFLRGWDQIRVPGGHQLFLAGVDLARDRSGGCA
jgi:uncharacterized circularly permuted ATP-grasp superfamily protein